MPLKTAHTWWVKTVTGKEEVKVQPAKVPKKSSLQKYPKAWPVPLGQV